MKKILLALSCLSFAHTSLWADSSNTTAVLAKVQNNHEQLDYSASGSAEVTINRPVHEVFNILTNVNTWPQINKGVTQAIAPKSVTVDKGVKFKESIASPIPGIKDWTNEWTVVEFEKDKKFVIAGIEEFAQVPIHSKITYEFDAKNKYTTEFERTIEVTLDEKFIQGAAKSEVEALYRFLGSQWEMANHLKHYVEKQPQK